MAVGGEDPDPPTSPLPYPSSFNQAPPTPTLPPPPPTKDPRPALPIPTTTSPRLHPSIPNPIPPPLRMARPAAELSTAPARIVRPGPYRPPSSTSPAPCHATLAPHAALRPPGQPVLEAPACRVAQWPDSDRP